MKHVYIALFFIAVVCSACDPAPDIAPPKETEGYVPIYSKDESVKKITAEVPRATIKSGKMYTAGNLLFQVEPDSGVHIINYADPRHPQKISFIHSMLCKELAVKNGFIYTNNFSDLVVIDIRDMNHIHEVSRTEDVFPDLALQYPARDSALGTIYFECPDPSKGVITGWTKQTIKNPKCWR
jgi:hypothetical protein